MSTAHATYSPRPPTSNTLSPHDRAHLLRSTNKLGKVLGSTPRFVDDLETDASGHIRHRSTDSLTSLSSVSSSRSVPNPSAHSHSLRRLNAPSVPTADDELLAKLANMSLQPESYAPPSKRRPPLLKLTLEGPHPPPYSSTPSLAGRPSLESIPGSPPPYAYHAPSTTAHGVEYTISLPQHRTSSSLDHPSPPLPRVSSPPPTSVSQKRAKLERLKRTLGEPVPLDLVFPPPSSIPSTPALSRVDSTHSFSSSSSSGSSSREPCAYAEEAEEEDGMGEMDYATIRNELGRISRMGSRSRKGWVGKFRR